MLPRHQALVSEEQFLALPESMNRVELLDGEVVVSPAPSLRHQHLLLRLARALAEWADSTSGSVTVGISPVDFRFASGRILQPDAFVLLTRVDLDAAQPIDRIPELCIEVLSTNRLYDRVTKRAVYAQGGVQEYWCVDPAGVIERWSGEGLSARDELTERLATPLLPGFSLDITALFAT